MAILLIPIGQASAQSSDTTPTNGCLPFDVTADNTVEVLRHYITSSDSFDVRLRKGLGLAGLTVDQISYVTDEPICAAAMRPYNHRAATPGRPRRVYVWSIGSRYMVEDPADVNPGSYRSIWIFDSAWAYQGGYAPN